MGYLIGAIVLGMLIWAAIEILQTIRSWEPNPSATHRKFQAEMLKETYCGQFGGDAVEGGSQAVGHAIHHTCEASPTAIAHTLEGLLHAVHH